MGWELQMGQCTSVKIICSRGVDSLGVRGGSPEEGGAHEGEEKVVRRNLLAGLNRLAPADDDRGHEACDAGRDVHDVATLRAQCLVIGQTGLEIVQLSKSDAAARERCDCWTLS